MAPPKPRALVPFEVGQRNEYIRIHHGAADMGLPDVFAAAHGHVHLIRPLQAVCNNDLQPVENGENPFS